MCYVLPEIIESYKLHHEENNVSAASDFVFKIYPVNIAAYKKKMIYYYCTRTFCRLHVTVHTTFIPTKAFQLSCDKKEF